MEEDVATHRAGHHSKRDEMKLYCHSIYQQRGTNVYVKTDGRIDDPLRIHEMLRGASPCGFISSGCWTRSIPLKEFKRNYEFIKKVN